MTLNLGRLIWKCLWDFLIEMSRKGLNVLSDVTATVWNEQLLGEPLNSYHEEELWLGLVALGETCYMEL